MKYYVNINEQDNGDHEVHKETCEWLPNVSNRIYLGEFDTCNDALQKAKETYPQSDGCFHCCKECHTT